MTDIGIMVRSANPVPDESQQLTDDELGAVLLLAQQRSGDMDTKQAPDPVAELPPKKRAGWLVAAAAFAVVFVVLGSAWLMSRESEVDAPPATTPPTTDAAPPTTDVAPPSTQAAAEKEEATTTSTTTAPELDADAVRYLEAMVAEINAGDHESAAERIASADQFLGGNPLGNANSEVGQTAELYEYWSSLGNVLSVDSCRQLSSGITRCVVAVVSEYEPWYPEPETNVFELRVDSGRLKFMRQTPRQADPWYAVWLDWNAWAEENLPSEDFAAMFFPYSNGTEAAELQKQYIELWRAEVGG